ncbi:SAV_6107 family HEPN domain-containing protein [Gordonia sp. CPCC 205515]|uniref:SAV_6107 family HEPN domain-containing protein n=1 Tax=Gordonia sp. CPCC 205515 TaxID=3140791 RepID=UPI003AF3995C
MVRPVPATRNPAPRAPAARTPVEVDPVVVRRSRDLLDRAEILFENADGIDDSAERFRQYYLASLRAAGAAIEVYEPSNRPVRRRTSRNAWSRLSALVPGMSGAAEYFAARSVIRSDVETGLRRTVDLALVVAMRGRVIDLLDDVDALLIAYEQGKLGEVAAPGNRTA